MRVKTFRDSYPIYLERGALSRVGELFHLDRKVLVVTDSGVPKQYADTVVSACRDAVLVTIPEGEKSKTLDTWFMLLETMTENTFTRTDCVVAVGGGVVGDLAGFAAACYMRGIGFYNIPTTVLSQVDSSIGGKTAVDFGGIKNIVGAFYPPLGVIIDPEVLATLPQRQISNGLAESVKMAITCDADLFSLLESADLSNPMVLDEIIYRSLLIKKHIVEQDEHESGIRKVLNFGHTLAHAVESIYGMETYYHGECVAIGMLPMCTLAVRDRLIPILERLSLPTVLIGGTNALLSACRHDKKASEECVTVVTVPEIGRFELNKITFDELESRIEEAAK